MAVKEEKKIETTSIDFSRLKPSDTVYKVVEILSKYEMVNTSTIVGELLRYHSEYAKEIAKKINKEEIISGAERKHVEQWLKEVYLLYNPNKIKELDGRLFIIGLSILDNLLLEKPIMNKFFKELISEISEPIESLLTPEAQKRWRHTRSLINGTLPNDIDKKRLDTVPTHRDDSAQVDELGREVFAEALSMRIRQNRYDIDQKTDDGISEQERLTRHGAFLIHIHGPWGSGKTSLLNFLKKFLSEGHERDLGEKYNSSPWIVVDFNAWQHQRIRPPWWSLMDKVFKEAVRQLNRIRRRNKKRNSKTHEKEFKSKPDEKKFYSKRHVLNLRIREWIWRLKTGRLHLYITILLFIWLLVILTWTFLPGSTGDSNFFIILADYTKPISTIIAFLVTIWGVMHGISRSLVPGSARAARAFMASSRDPLHYLRNHFSDLVDWIGQPVAIFIDDLDRCRGSYAVELLEGIQTLFRNTKVTYVIAADRRWLRTSYENEYAAFTDMVGEPARPLGYLFLEKTFQLSVSLPRLSPEIKEQYWNSLLLIKKSENQKDLEKERADAQKKALELSTEEDILAELKRETGNPIYKQAFREAVVLRLMAPEVEKHTEHILKPFAPLLEPNPRAMKRFVNAYSAQRALDILRGEKKIIDPMQLALWTIIVLRWPILAEFLEDNPKMVRYIGKTRITSDEIPKELQPLFKDQNIYNVVKGNVEGKKSRISLDEMTIRHLAGLRTSDSLVRRQ